jgi:aspartate racemase
MAIKNKNLKTVALLGTKYTMQMAFYKDRLLNYGISTIIPGDEDIEFVNHSIYEEFSKGIFLPATKKVYQGIIDKLVAQGVEGVIFGCTEIPILLKQEDCPVPVFDTAFIHSMAAIDFALQP